MPLNPAVTLAVRTISQTLGINPDTAVRVMNSEGGPNPDAIGDQGSSFGPFQLHYGGIAPPPNDGPGLGDDFTRQTGLHARNPATWPQQIEWVLRYVLTHGWGAFHGAARVGVGNWDGIPRGGGGDGGGSGGGLPIGGSDGLPPGCAPQLITLLAILAWVIVHGGIRFPAP